MATPQNSAAEKGSSRGRRRGIRIPPVGAVDCLPMHAILAELETNTQSGYTLPNQHSKSIKSVEDATKTHTWANYDVLPLLFARLQSGDCSRCGDGSARNNHKRGK